ncbi:MAG TPA: protein kinase [Candidatus Binatia bacterium]|nr:protein kinase [Candidatus Binatia bacterium]
MTVPGERVLHYRILRPLGAGGMGEVFLAEDEKLGRRVALKFLPRMEAADPERRERLKREARALASLSHPGIAAIHALEEHDGRLFLVMEYIEGETLGERLARRPLPVPELIDRALTLAEALAHAHGRGVIHRDIKPGNVLITPEGGTKLADFGLALLGGETRLTAEGVSAGTADHMSPEQTRGQTLDARSDLFSLGVTLYESLTGVRPFARGSLEATFHAVRAEEPEPPTALRSGIPLELDRIVVKLLRKDPGERYQTASDLAADLRALRSRESRASEMATALAGGGAGSGPAFGAGTASTSGAAAGAGTASTPGPAAGADPIEPSKAKRARRRWPRIFTAAASLVVAIATVVSVWQKHHGAAEAAPSSIAVLSFQHMADRADSKGEGSIATSLLTVGLGQSQVMPVLSTQRVHDVMRQLGKADQAVTGADALEVGRRAGATYIVVGYIYRTAPDVVLGAEVSSTQNGQVLTSCRVEAPGGDRGLFAAVDSLTIALRHGLARAGVQAGGPAVDVAGLTTRDPAAYRSYVRGVDLLHRAENAEAAAALQEAVQADSTFALAWYYLAVATWWTQDFTGAEREVEKAMRLGNRMVGRERDGLRALHDLVGSHYRQAAAEYRALLRRYPDDKEFLYGLGEALYHDGADIEAARAAFDRTVELDPTFAVAYQHIIDIEVERGDKGRPVALAQKLHQMNPTNPVPMNLEMEALGRLGDAEAVARVARQVLARDPKDPYSRFRLAVYYRMKGEFDSSAAYARSGNFPEGIAAFVEAERVWLPLSQGRYREADRVSKEILGGIPPTSLVPVELLPSVFPRVRLLVAAGRYDEAWALTRQVSATLRSVDPRGVGLQFLGDISLQTGHLAEAERQLREFDGVLAKYPGVRERRLRDFLAGLIALAKGHAGQALPLLDSGESEGPAWTKDNGKDWARARALLAAGARERALPVLERVVARGPFGGEPTFTFAAAILLAREYEAQGRKPEALELYRRVAYQYRLADPGVRANEEAKAAIARLEQERAQAAANR